VCRFTGEQISRFLHGWYHAIQRRATGGKGRNIRVEAAAKADDLLGRLRTRPVLYDLAANPLLLTMIANVHRYRGALPGSRAELYGEMCQVLVHRRQEAKRITDPAGLKGPQKEHIMQVLALTMMDAKLRDIPAGQACTAITPALEGASTTLPAADFLREVMESGLLVEREHGHYAFAHLTLQEYLAATHIGTDGIARLTAAVDDPWWRETTLLWSATADATLCRSNIRFRVVACGFAAEVLPGLRASRDGVLPGVSDRPEVAGSRADHLAQ
jgi:predicted NACHT family NTPase